MANSLIIIVIKEVKEFLRDPKILVGVVLMPLLLFPIMGSAINISQESVRRAITSASFAVYDEDKGPISEPFIGYLRMNNTVISVDAPSLKQALIEFQAGDASTLLYIPAGFSENISRGSRGGVKLYANLKSLNLAESGSTDVINTLISYYNYAFSIALIDQLLTQTGRSANPGAIHDPISVSYGSVIKGNVLEIAPQAILGLIMSQSIMLPVLVMIMIMFAIQMAATSIALEKEQKTLETLMTLPVGRMTILSGKLGGSIVVAIAGAIAYMVGFGFYLNSAFSFAPSVTSMSVESMSLGVQPVGYILLGVNIFVTLVSALALAICIAVFADNVRSAQSLVGVLIVPVMIPAIILMFTDLEMLPTWVQWALLVIPYTHSIVASKAAFLGNYLVVLRSIAYISVFTVLVLYLAARIFSTERILTARIMSFNLKDIMRRK